MEHENVHLINIDLMSSSDYINLGKQIAVLYLKLKEYKGELNYKTNNLETIETPLFLKDGILSKIHKELSFYDNLNLASLKKIDNNLIKLVLRLNMAVGLTKQLIHCDLNIDNILTKQDNSFYYFKHFFLDICKAF